MNPDDSENIEENLKRRRERFVSKADDFTIHPPATGLQRLTTWQRLNTQQVGAYAEYFVKMFLTMKGFQVYSAEVDDRGIDFVARYEKGSFIEIQVKSMRFATGYIFAEKSKFELSKTLYLALVIFNRPLYPDIYFIPSTRWENADRVFVRRDYIGKKSKPEWGINISAKNMHALSQFKAETSIDELKKI